MHFIGIDQSLNHTAVAVTCDQGTLIDITTINVGQKIRGIERLDYVVKKLITFIEPYAPFANGCIEGPSFASTHREFDLGEISGVIKQQVFAVYGITLNTVAPTQVKVFGADNGAADKQKMLASVKSNWGHDFGKDDNKADAFILAQVATALHGEYPFKFRKQVDVINKLREVETEKSRVKIVIPRNHV